MGASAAALSLASPAKNLLSLLVIDDERAIRDACREIAEALGYEVSTAENAERAFRLLGEKGHDIALLDLRLPGASGLEALHRLRQSNPEMVIVVMTGYATVSSAVEAMKLGAHDYMTKPFSMEDLRTHLDSVATLLKTKNESRLQRARMKSSMGFGSIIGQSPEMERLYRIIAKAARSTHPVLVLGESGTGKEMVARSIHFTGPFKDKPYIPVDCGSLVPTLIESELFGHVKGAFTGANQSKEGLLAIAEGGTVFLDEIGELPVDLQSKLLRAIQEKEIRPVGSTKRISINVRILAATNRDLEQAVVQGTFRRDLYFRLNVLTLRLPSLRERRDDIPLLISHFLDRLAQTTDQKKSLSDEAMELLMKHDWPGNVRELENCLERSWALSSGPILQVSDLPSDLRSARTNVSFRAASGSQIIPMAELEKQAILATIEQVKGDKLMAARLLKIGKTTLYRKLKEYDSHV
jgi:two-component system response regulator HydG